MATFSTLAAAVDAVAADSARGGLDPSVGVLEPRSRGAGLALSAAEDLNCLLQIMHDRHQDFGLDVLRTLATIPWGFRRPVCVRIS